MVDAIVGDVHSGGWGKDCLFESNKSGQRRRDNTRAALIMIVYIPGKTHVSYPRCPEPELFASIAAYSIVMLSAYRAARMNEEAPSTKHLPLWLHEYPAYLKVRLSAD